MTKLIAQKKNQKKNKRSFKSSCFLCLRSTAPPMGCILRLLTATCAKKKSSRCSFAGCIHTYLRFLFSPSECEIENVKAPAVVIGNSSPSKDKSAGTKSTSNWKYMLVERALKRNIGQFWVQPPIHAYRQMGTADWKTNKTARTGEKERMRSDCRETVKCETQNKRPGSKDEEALNWQSQPRLPAGTAVRLELGVSLANQLLQHGVSWALFSSVSSTALSGAWQSLLSTPCHRSAPAITPQIKWVWDWETEGGSGGSNREGGEVKRRQGWFGRCAYRFIMPALDQSGPGEKAESEAHWVI